MIIAIVIVFYALTYLRFAEFEYNFLFVIFLAVSVAIYILLYYFMGLYAAKRHKHYSKEFLVICYSNAITLFVLNVGLRWLDAPNYMHLVLFVSVAAFLFINSIARYLLRVSLREIRKRGYNQKYLLLIGGGELAVKFAQKIEANPQYGYRFYGCLSDKAMKTCPVEFLGKIPVLQQHLASNRVDEVIIALELDEYHKIPGIISVCEKNGIKVNVVPAYYEYVPSNPQMDEIDGLPVMTLRKIPLSNPLLAAFKRLFDIIVSLFCIVIFGPVMLAAWLGARLSTKESAVFKQERIGLNFKPFIMYKFKTMLSVHSGAVWTKQKDSRRTKFGISLRKFSIDELPQFFNILRGDMSLVGPRPEIAEFVAQFKETIPRYMVRHQVKPGITGWAQIHNFRGDTSIMERIKSDIYYIENWSPALDIQIIIRTMLCAFYNPNE